MTTTTTLPLSRDEAKRRAGYGAMDTPCEPRRSAYTPDDAGSEAYARALGLWYAFNALADSAA